MAAVIIKNLVTTGECFMLDMLKADVKHVVRSSALSLQREELHMTILRRSATIGFHRNMSIEVSGLSDERGYTSETLDQAASEIGAFIGRRFPEQKIECTVCLKNSMVHGYWSSEAE